jgi:dTDP-4-amino-4,6-dideoxygalactose transaminase
MFNKIPFVDLSYQHNPLEDEIKNAINTVISRGDFILGQAVTEFEKAFSTASGVSYGVGVASGTEAIALGLQACGVGKNDEVIVPTNTFIATIIGILKTGATPILVDCDLDTALIDLSAINQVITNNTKAILPVHLYGQMVSPSEILKIAQQHDLLIFEDAAQAHLAHRENYLAGSVGIASAFSFYPSKNLGAFGNGGLLITKDEKIAQNVKTLRNYGAPQKYLHTELGTNSRLDTIQAAILNVKLPHLNHWNNLRNKAGKLYDLGLKELGNQGIIPIKNVAQEGHIYHLYVVRVTENCPVSKDELQNKLAEKGIQTGIHYPLPCHLQPAYKFLGYDQGTFPNAELLSEQILSLPMYPGLEEPQIEYVVETIKSIVTK